MNSFRTLDRVLRGDLTSSDAIAGGGLAIPVRPLLELNAALAAFYGMCMGGFGLFRPDGPEWRQLAAGAAKVPLLFALTLLVTFPSLYVFNTLLGSRLRVGDLLQLVAAALSVLVSVLAAFGPVVVFFSVTTTSYPFILLLNVAVFAAAGVFGLGFLHTVLSRLTAARRSRPTPPAVDGGDYELLGPDVPTTGVPMARVAAVVRPPAAGGRHPVIYAWMVMFGLVGAQMGWVLRPFVGAPNLPFAWLRPRESSFFEAVARAVHNLLAGG